MKTGVSTGFRRIAVAVVSRPCDTIHIGNDVHRMLRDDDTHAAIAMDANAAFETPTLTGNSFSYGSASILLPRVRHVRPEQPGAGHDVSLEFSYPMRVVGIVGADESGVLRADFRPARR